MSFQQCRVLKCVDLDEPLQHPFKLRNSKCSLSSSPVLRHLTESSITTTEINL